MLSRRRQLGPSLTSCSLFFPSKSVGIIGQERIITRLGQDSDCNVSVNRVSVDYYMGNISMCFEKYFCLYSYSLIF